MRSKFLQQNALYRKIFTKQEKIGLHSLKEFAILSFGMVGVIASTL